MSCVQPISAHWLRRLAAIAQATGNSLTPDAESGLLRQKLHLVFQTLLNFIDFIIEASNILFDFFLARLSQQIIGRPNLLALAS